MPADFVGGFFLRYGFRIPPPLHDRPTRPAD